MEESLERASWLAWFLANETFYDFKHASGFYSESVDLMFLVESSGGKRIRMGQCPVQSAVFRKYHIEMGFFSFC